MYTKKNRSRGSALFVAVMMMLTFSMILINGVAVPVFQDTKNIQETSRSKQALRTAESGLEDVVIRIKNNMLYDEVETLSLGGTYATTTADTSVPSDIIVAALGLVRDAVRKTEVGLIVTDGVSFNYGVQAGEGGIVLENSASILGNVNANGPVTGSGSNLIQGSVISSGPTGLVSGIYATSSVYAHTITNITTDGDAYYENISGSTVHGSLFPGSPDQQPSEMPISDEQIEEWKNAALLGGVINSPCPYKISGETTIGPVKINCDLEISGNNYNLFIGGHIWVDGDIIIKNSPTLKVAPLISGQSTALIADNDSQRSTGGTIELENKAFFEGTGDNSYILFVSKNNSASTGGSNTAIEVQNTVDGDLLVYAPDGEILLQNSINLKEVTAYKIRIKNTAEVVYETGLINLLFDSGPGGGFGIGSWKEI